MNEYHIQKENQKAEKLKQQHDLNQQSQKVSAKGKTYSKEFVKVNYRDEDMRKLAVERKGTTSSYAYS